MFKIIKKIKNKFSQKTEEKSKKQMNSKKENNVQEKYLKTKFLKLVTTIIALFLSLFAFTFAAEDGSKVENFFNYLIWDILFSATWLFMSGAGILFDNFLGLTLYTGFYNQDFVKIVWTSLRDFANVAFILSLVYIAISIMLQDIFSVRKNLIKLIVIAFLINFSFFFTRLIIDAGNVTGLAFYNAIAIETNDSDREDYMLPFFKNNEILDGKSISAGVISATGVKSEGGPNDAKLFEKSHSYGKSAKQKMVLGLFYSFFFFMFGRSFLIAAFGFISRTIWLVIYIIFSPLAFVAYFLPGSMFSKYFSDWITGLLNRSFGIAIYLLMMYIIFKFIQLEVLQSGGALAFQEHSGSKELIVLILPLLVKGLIMYTLVQKANEISVKFNENGSSLGAKVFSAAAKVAMPLAITPMGKVVGGVSKMAKVGVRTKVGGAAYNALYGKDSKIGKYLAEQSAKGGAAGLAANMATLGIRGVSDSKFGTDKSHTQATQEEHKKINELKSLRERALGDDGKTKLQAHENLHKTKVTGFAKTEKGKRLELETQKEINKVKTNYYNEETGDKMKDKKAQEANKKLLDIENKNTEKVIVKDNEIKELEKKLKNAKTEVEKEEINKDLKKVKNEKIAFERERLQERTKVHGEVRQMNLAKNNISKEEIEKQSSNIYENALGNNLDHTEQKKVSPGLIGGFIGNFTPVGSAAQDVMVTEHQNITDAEIKKEAQREKQRKAYSTLSEVHSDLKHEYEEEARRKIKKQKKMLDEQNAKIEQKRIERESEADKKHSDVVADEEKKYADVIADVKNGNLDSKESKRARVEMEKDSDELLKIQKEEKNILKKIASNDGVDAKEMKAYLDNLGDKISGSDKEKVDKDVALLKELKTKAGKGGFMFDEKANEAKIEKLQKTISSTIGVATSAKANDVNIKINTNQALIDNERNALIAKAEEAKNNEISKSKVILDDKIKETNDIYSKDIEKAKNLTSNIVRKIRESKEKQIDSSKAYRNVQMAEIRHKQEVEINKTDATRAAKWEGKPFEGVGEENQHDTPS